MRDCARIPGISWTGPPEAREGRPVAALRAEPQVGAHLAAQPEVGDEFRPGQGQEVQVPARPLAPIAAVEERRTCTPWQRATQDRESLGSPVVEGDHDGVGLPGRRHLDRVASVTVVGHPDDDVRSFAWIVQDPACREGRQPGHLLYVHARAGEAPVGVALLSPAGAPVELAEPEVAVGDERAHLELLCQGEGASEMRLGCHVAASQRSRRGMTTYERLHASRASGVVAGTS